MITVKVIGASADRKQIIVSADTTIKECFDKAGINRGNSAIYLDGIPVSASEINATLEDMHITEGCTLSAITKSDAA